MVQCAEQGEIVRIPEEAVAKAAEEAPATLVAQPTTTEPDPGIPSLLDPAVHKLLTGYQDQWESLRENGHVWLVCFPSQALLISDPACVSREQLFKRLPDPIGFDESSERGLELCNSLVTATLVKTVGTSITMSV